MRHLTLFLSAGVGLSDWDRIGSLDRELALYRQIQARGIRVALVSEGGREELRYGRSLPGIDICCNRWRLSPRRYRRWAGLLHWPRLHRTDLVKTNQASAGPLARRCARLWRRPLVARCGYLWSLTERRRCGPGTAAAHRARRVEEALFAAARRIVVTASAMQDEIAARLPEAAAKIRVIPNYVLTDRFAPQPGAAPGHDVVYVGRIAPEKNLDRLLAAAAEASFRVTLVGEGPLRASLAASYGHLGDRLRWIPRIDHLALPALLNDSRLFVLPSRYEGHPKALIEAMACGMPVVGADRPGIRELIRHGETGWLCAPTPDALRRAIVRLLGDPGLCRRLGRQARSFAVAHFSLSAVVRQELALYRELVPSAP